MCQVVSAGSKSSRTVSAEAKYDGQSLQEAKISGLVYTLFNVINLVLQYRLAMNTVSGIKYTELPNIFFSTQPAYMD